VSKERDLRFSKAISLTVIALLVIEALLTTIVVLQFGELFNEIEKEIPIITKIVLSSPFYIWCLPLFSILMHRNNVKKNKGAGYGLPAIFIIGILWFPLVIYSMYLPVLS